MNKVSAKKNGVDIDFKNRQFGIFFSEFPLIESFRRNAHLKDKLYAHQFLKGLYHFKNVSSYYDALVLSSVVYDWDIYRLAILNGDSPTADLFSKKIEIATYKNDEN